MRTGAAFLIAFLALAGATSAHEVVSSAAGTRIGTVQAGTTPDSFLYGLDVFIDDIRYLSTFDGSAKSRLGMEITRERLLEAREMVIKNKSSAAQAARNEHAKALERIKASVTALSRSNSTEELREEIELERELEEHEEEVKTVSEELKIKIKIRGEITPGQQALVDSILNLMQNKTGEVKIKIENRKGETKIKIKAETGKSELEIKNETEKLEEKAGLSAIKQKRAGDRIEDALEELAEAKAKLLQANVTQANITAVNELISQAEQKLTLAQAAFNETRFGEAFGLANAAEQLARNAEKMLERFLEKAEEREIEVEIENGTAKIKVKVGDLNLRYRLNATNREEITADIAGKTGLSPAEISAITEFEAEEADKGGKIEVKTGKGIAKVKVDFGGQRQKFILSTTNRTVIVGEIVNRTGLAEEQVQGVIDFKTRQERAGNKGKKE